MPTKYLKDKSVTENLYLAIFDELPECDMETSDLDSLFEILDTLTSTEEYVIKRRFGLLGMPRRTQREVTQPALGLLRDYSSRAPSSVTKLKS